MKKLIAATAGLALVAGCASIFSTSNYAVAVDSVPSGAPIKVTDDNGYTLYDGLSPTTLNLKSGDGFFRGAKYTITSYNAEGVAQSTSISAGIDGWYFANLFIGGILGMVIIDPATGAMWSLPSRVTVNVAAEPKNMSNVTLKIMTLADVPEEMREELVPIG